MKKEEIEGFNYLVDLDQELTERSLEFWHQYSGFDDWHFWTLVALTVIPLIVLYFFIDRRRMFHLGFFGFSVHIVHFYIDTASVHMGNWVYPYRLMPIFPISFAFDASFIPVTFMLSYQWILNRKKNFYLYAIIPAFFFGFIAKPLLVMTEITLPGPSGGGIKAYFILFLSHLLIAYFSKWLTDLFRKHLVKDNYNIQNLEDVTEQSHNWFRVKNKD